MNQKIEKPKVVLPTLPQEELRAYLSDGKYYCTVWEGTKTNGGQPLIHKSAESVRAFAKRKGYAVCFTGSAA